MKNIIEINIVSIQSLLKDRNPSPKSPQYATFILALAGSYMKSNIERPVTEDFMSFNFPDE